MEGLGEEVTNKSGGQVNLGGVVVRDVVEHFLKG
jgi:hypothetical protein